MLVGAGCQGKSKRTSCVPFGLRSDVKSGVEIPKAWGPDSGNLEKTGNEDQQVGGLTSLLWLLRRIAI